MGIILVKGLLIVLAVQMILNVTLLAISVYQMGDWTRLSVITALFVAFLGWLQVLHYKEDEE